jgi:hypothetical protein
MSIFYCESCGRHIDTDYQDGADYSDTKHPVCQDCAEERELEFAAWQQLIESEELRQ